MALTSNKFKRSSLLGVSSASTEFGYPNSDEAATVLPQQTSSLCPHDIAFASNAFGYPNAASCSAFVRAVSPAGSVSASAFGRGVRRTPAPLKPFERRNSWIIKIWENIYFHIGKIFIIFNIAHLCPNKIQDFRQQIRIDRSSGYYSWSHCSHNAAGYSRIFPFQRGTGGVCRLESGIWKE